MTRLIGWIVLGALLGAIAPLHAGEVLSDAELAGVTAGSAAAVYEDGRVRFDLEKTTGSGRHIGARGDVDLHLGPTTVDNGLLRLEHNAQGNLSALVNTNAVNSPVQVLINLNVNIESVVHSINQVNGALQQR